MINDFSALHRIEALVARLKLDESLGCLYVSNAPPLHELEAVVKRLRNDQARHNVGTPAAARPRPEPPAGNGGGLILRFPRSSPEPEPANAGTPPPGSPPPAPFSGFTLVPYLPPPPCPEKEQELEPLRREAETCSRCGLCAGRTHMVWGEGSLDARIMFIGEGPGKDEDEQGRPFVGRSGRLLADIIEKGMKAPRNLVYIANVVKCRPPGNRDPKPEEVAACSVYLNRQIDVIRPKALVAVGNVAGRSLLGLEPGAKGLRGRWHERDGIPLRVIYHPSYLLRARKTPDDRTAADRETWQDIQEIMRNA